MANWRWAVASKIGTSHERLGTRKQDAFKCWASKTPNILFAIVCDGAGSAEYGGEGASIACKMFSSFIKIHSENENPLPSDEELKSWIDEIRDVLGNAANIREKNRKVFACTVVMLIATLKHVTTAHIGDGAIVGRRNDGTWEILSQPENGEYASTTYFLTDDPEPKLRTFIYDNNFSAFSIFSDGIETLALDLKTMTPHAPFFETMIKPIDASVVEGKEPILSDALGKFLASSRVCERTDDDKTFILISGHDHS